MNRGEKGMNIPDIERLMNVANLGKVTVSYILYGYIYSKMLKEGNKVNQLEKLVPFRMGVVSYFVLLIILVLLFRIFSTVSIFPTPIQA